MHAGGGEPSPHGICCAGRVEFMHSGTCVRAVPAHNQRHDPTRHVLLLISWDTLSLLSSWGLRCEWMCVCAELRFQSACAHLLHTKHTKRHNFRPWRSSSVPSSTRAAPALSRTACCHTSATPGFCWSPRMATASTDGGVSRTTVAASQIRPAA